MDVRSHPHVFDVYSGTEDLQRVYFQVRILTRLDPDNIVKLYREIGEDYENKVLRSVVNEIINKVIANHDAQFLLQHRLEMYNELCQNIRERLATFNIFAEDVAIVNMKYGDEFTKSCEYKMSTQQRAERQKYYVLRSEREKQAQIILAEGEGKSADMISNAATKAGNGYIQLKQISVYIF